LGELSSFWDNSRKEKADDKTESEHILVLQVLTLLHDSTLQSPIYRATVAVLEGMQTHQSNLADELLTKPLLSPMLKCIDSAGKIAIFFVCHIEIHLLMYYSQGIRMTPCLEVGTGNTVLKMICNDFLLAIFL